LSQTAINITIYQQLVMKLKEWNMMTRIKFKNK